MAKTFVSNIIIDLSSIWASTYTLKCLKTGWGGLFTSTHCCHLVSLEWQWKVAQIFACPNTAVDFKDRNWIPKTIHCISCLVVCKIVFAPNSPIFWITLVEKHEEEEEEHRQLQSIMRFTQTQWLLYFNIFPFLYEENKYLWEFIERRYIMNR